MTVRLSPWKMASGRKSHCRECVRQHHTKENVVAACMHCNCSKKEKDTLFILTTKQE